MSEEGVLMPRLRFPEFKNADAWATKKLGGLVSITVEKVGDAVCVPMSITSGVGLVSQVKKFGRVIAGDSYKNYLRLEVNDFAYNKSATKEYPEGYLAIYSGKESAAVPNSIFTCFRVNGETPVPAYLNYLFQGNLHGRWLRKFIKVGARAHGSLSINDSDLLALPVPIPTGESSIAEQNKIAACLNSLDELIDEQARKVNALKVHNRGLIQLLFPRKGETRPRFRFPDFQSCGDWKLDKLQSLCTASVSYGIVQPGPHVPGGMPYIQSSDLSSELHVNRLSRTSEKIAAKHRRSEVRPGDIVFSLRGDIGASRIVPDEIPVANLARGAARMRPKGSSEFFLHALKSQFVSDGIAAATRGSTFQEISLAALREIPIFRPELDEQLSIADCLSSLDRLTIMAIQELRVLKTHKRGLMQLLFPSTETLDA